MSRQRYLAWSEPTASRNGPATDERSDAMFNSDLATLTDADVPENFDFASFLDTFAEDASHTSMGQSDSPSILKLSKETSGLVESLDQDPKRVISDQSELGDLDKLVLEFIYIKGEHLNITAALRRASEQ